jgi:peptidoglycan/xylan/chitin deacetylase (PgdA/CDA1 family)
MIKVPKIIKLLFFNQVWDIPNSENTIYLTFDDGPTPEITERVLEILEKPSNQSHLFLHW